MERELGKEGHRKALWHMVMAKSLWWELREHMVELEVMAQRLLRRRVEHLPERMACRETKLEARAEDMQDPVTKRVEMALIMYNPQVTTMEVRPQPDWRLRQSEEAGEEEGQVGDEQRERLMARRWKKERQVSEQGRKGATTGSPPGSGRPKQLEAGGGSRRGRGHMPLPRRSQDKLWTGSSAAVHGRDGIGKKGSREDKMGQRRGRTNRTCL